MVLKISILAELSELILHQMSRDLTFLAKSRKGIIPVFGDVRKYAEWQIYVPNKVNWIFQDVAQSAQVDIFLGACQKF